MKCVNCVRPSSLRWHVLNAVEHHLYSFTSIIHIFIFTVRAGCAIRSFNFFRLTWLGLSLTLHGYSLEFFFLFLFCTPSPGPSHTTYLQLLHANAICFGSFKVFVGGRARLLLITRLQIRLSRPIEFQSVFLLNSLLLRRRRLFSASLGKCTGRVATSFTGSLATSHQRKRRLRTKTRRWQENTMKNGSFVIVIHVDISSNRKRGKFRRPWLIVVKFSVARQPGESSATHK